MNKGAIRIVAAIFLWYATVSGVAHAQTLTAVPPAATMPSQPSQAAPAYTQAQIDQMIAPIALYPDPLIGQILMASTYPLEVVEAARWLKSSGNASLQGDQLAAALAQQPWDPSVKSLVAFPQVLHMMDSNLQWTEQLGDAFLAQQTAVMDSVQRLRSQAQTAGNLASTPQQTISTQGQDIIIEPANPDVVYVPAYNPTVVYGAWPYPDYPPFYFYPPGYVWGPALIGFGVGIVVTDFLWGWDHWDWQHHRIDIDDGRFRELNRGHAPISSGVWQHDPDHRRGVPYRDAATRARFQGVSSPETRRNFRGYGTPVATTPQTNRTAFSARQMTGSSVQPNSGTPPLNRAPISVGSRAAVTRPTTSSFSGRQRSSTRISVQRPATPMFESFARGADVRTQSARGSMSRATAPSAVASRGGEAHSSGGDSRGGRDNGGGGRR